MMDRRKIDSRIYWLLDELLPLSYHSDLTVAPHAYDPRSDTLYVNANPKIAAKWAETAYQFGKDAGVKYDRYHSVYGIDGQPRVSGSGLVWVRFVSPFEDDSSIGLHVWSRQPSHCQAEEQLGKYYAMFLERDGLEPMQVFQKFL
ncbi:MAG: hypothetical protein ACFFB3_24445 [Candidatus Hodarchaeota archaeon]